MPELRRIRDRLSLRDFVTAVRKCERGRLLIDPELLPPTLPPVDEIGRSRDDLSDALRRATERVPRAAEAALTAEQRDDVLTDVDATDVFDRPAFLTFYGIGDSDRD
jgi:predicted nuclease with RNAse H fold